MIILHGSDNLVLGSSIDTELQVYISYVDLFNKEVTPGRYSNIFTESFESNVIGSTQGYRTIKTISIKNTGDESTNIVIKHNLVELYTITVGPGGVLQYNSESGFSYQSKIVLENFIFADKIIPTILSNPNDVIYEMQRAGNLAPSPTNISTTVVRCSLFRPYKGISVNNIRYYGIFDLNNIYRVAIYRYSDRVRLTDQLSLNISANTWGSVASSFNLDASVLYFCAVSVSSTGSSAALASIGTSISSTTGRINSTPGNLPGSLNPSYANLNNFTFQFSTTSGSLPMIAPTLDVQSAWTGGMPVFFLDNL